MNNLTLFKQENFGEIKCNLLKNEDDEIFMTSTQLSEILGYSSKDSFKSLLGRNPYIKYDLEFSRVVSVCTPL